MPAQPQPHTFTEIIFIFLIFNFHLIELMFSFHAVEAQRVRNEYVWKLSDADNLFRALCKKVYYHQGNAIFSCR